MVNLTFDYNENRDHNLALDVAAWSIGDTDKMGTAIEAGYCEDPNNITEDIIWDPKDPVPVELVEANSLLNEYLADNRICSPGSYVEWLERKMNAALNEVDRLRVAHDKLLTELHEIPSEVFGIQLKANKEPNAVMGCPLCNGKIEICENTLCSEREAVNVIVCPHCGQRIKA
jgi:hypothetical protein